MNSLCELKSPSPQPDLPFDAQLRHRYGGIGLALVATLPDEWCQVVYLAYKGYYPTHRPVYVWRRCLEVMTDAEGQPMMIGENQPLAELRERVSKDVDNNVPLMLA